MNAEGPATEGPAAGGPGDAAARVAEGLAAGECPEAAAGARAGERVSAYELVCRPCNY